MQSSNAIFDELNDSGPTLHGIVRPHPKSEDHVLFSTHHNAADAVPIPVAQIKSVTKKGDLRGLDPGSHSVDIILKKSIEDMPDVFSGLMNVVNKSLMEKTNPVYCYDDKGNWIPCP